MQRRRCAQGKFSASVTRRWASTLSQLLSGALLINTEKACSPSAIQLARRGRFLLSEALTVRDQALAGQVVGENELHWDEREGKQRLAEVMGRMQGPREPLEMLLGLHAVAP